MKHPRRGVMQGAVPHRPHIPATKWALDTLCAEYGAWVERVREDDARAYWLHCDSGDYWLWSTSKGQRPDWGRMYRKADKILRFSS